MVILKENTCRICPKVFCCSECRDVHETSKHPKPKCSLCVKALLPYKPTPSNEEDSRNESELLCHIVFNHLPLRCKLCGDVFTSSQELYTAKPCRWRSQEYRRRQLQQAQVQQQQQQIQEQNRLNSQAESVNPDDKLPLTPQYQSAEGGKSIADLSVSRLKQENFDSPPELARHTSTPVHMHNQPGLNQKPPGPQFSLKTPSSHERRCTFESTGSACSSQPGSADLESRYYTGRSSGIGALLLGRLSLESATNNADNTRENQSEAEPSWNSSTYLTSQKQQQQFAIPASAEISVEKRLGRADRSIMKPDALERINRVNESSRDSIEKRVRFSDQCQPPAPISSTSTEDDEAAAVATVADSSACFNDNDVYFEARENLDEDEKVEKVKVQPEQCSCCRRNSRVDEADDSPSSSSTGNNNNNNNEDKRSQNAADSSVGNNGAPLSTSTSRVVMMLVVEKTDSKGLSSLDLAPLIDSGLKKLEETVASANNSTNNDKGSHERSNGSGSVMYSAELSDLARKIIPDNFSGKGVSNAPSTLIKDNFVSISDRVECYATSGENTSTKQSQEAIAASRELAGNKTGSYHKSDGIFSVVARVVRSALKKLPVVGSVTSRNLSREPLPQHVCQPDSLSSSSFSIASAEVRAVGSSCLAAASASQIILQRSASKRPRDRLDSTEETAHVSTSRESPVSSGGSPRGEVVSSPVAKRPRGWYRIRAREPIARMREHRLGSPIRGASLETQRFQQGSLTIGTSDTLLPLPSRAHQGTQTEK